MTFSKCLGRYKSVCVSSAFCFLYTLRLQHFAAVGAATWVVITIHFLTLFSTIWSVTAKIFDAAASEFNTLSGVAEMPARRSNRILDGRPSRSICVALAVRSSTPYGRPS